jgi:hypothetical protein
MPPRRKHDTKVRQSRHDTLRLAIGLARPLLGQAIPTAERLPGLLALVDTLLAEGWLPPGGHAAAGKASAATRHGIQALRRILIEHAILPKLPKMRRKRLTSPLTVEKVHEELWLLGDHEHAGNSPVLKSCRKVAKSTVAEDLRQISLQSNAFNGNRGRKTRI